MGLLELPWSFVYVSLVLMHVVVKSVESTVVIRFDQTPPSMSRSSHATFKYSFKKLDGSNACQNNTCSIFAQLDGQVLILRSDRIVILKNLTVNKNHEFVLNVTTLNGERNSSTFSWFIDTIPPTATISSEHNYTNAERIGIDIKFSEVCGFKCVNSSACDVTVNGPGYINPTSLIVIKLAVHYKLDVIISPKSTSGRVIVTMADDVCTDQAGNYLKKINASSLTIHIDRRPVLVDFWTSVPSYELMISGVPRTVFSTNKMEDIDIFLDFSVPVMNSTEQVSNALRLNNGNLITASRNRGNRRFSLKLNVSSKTEIITVELQSELIIGRAGNHVLPIAPITFLYDTLKPKVRLSTSSPNVTKESKISVIVEFSKPVFGFEESMVNVTGGRITRVKELSKALYSLHVTAVTNNLVSVSISEGRLKDISGNPNLPSNQLEVRHYSTPSLSIALHSFITAGILATSLANALLSLSQANLGTMETLALGNTNVIASDPSRNLHGMIGHLQVFVLSDWLSDNQPVDFSETAKGLRWLIPHQELPWENNTSSVWPNRNLVSEGRISNILSKLSVTVEKASFGLALNTEEYFVYFLRGEPISANDVVNRMENYKGWKKLEMNLFWLGVGAGGLVTIHALLLVLVKWRTRIPVDGILSVPRFEIFLLILMLPCIAQASTFVIRGGTTAGIITGALLLAIPTAFILSICLFLVIAIFSGSLVQYKEVKHIAAKEPRCSKLLWFLTTRPVSGKWVYREGLPSSFLSRFGILFEGQKGPPNFVVLDQNDSNATQNWGGSSRYGIEETETRSLTRFLGCVRSSYIVIDLLRRVGLGIIAGERKSNLGIFALSITSLQFIYLFTAKPYISRGVYIAESVSLLCEIIFFGLSLGTTSTNPNLGFIFLSLLFITFVSQIINEWCALIISVLKLSHPEKNSLSSGLKLAIKGLVFPFLSRKHWPEAKVTLPLIPEKEMKRRGGKVKGVDRISGMSSSVVPVISPSGSPILDSVRRTGSPRERVEQTREMKKLRAMARASFTGDSNAK